MSVPVTGVAVGLSFATGLLLAAGALAHPAPPRTRRASRLAQLARDAQLPWVTPAAVLAACALAALVSALAALMVTAVPVVALLAAVVGAVLPLVVLRRRAARWRRSLRQAWPDAVDTLVSGVRAGMSLPDAAAALGASGPQPLRPAFILLAVEYRASGSFATALDVLQRRLADPVADRVVGALRLAREFGGSELGVILRTLSAMLREDARTRSEIEGRQSWTVAAARMAVAAPWVTLALLCTRPEAAHAFASPAGALLLVVSAAITALAYALMLRIGRLPADERIVR